MCSKTHSGILICCLTVICDCLSSGPAQKGEPCVTSHTAKAAALTVGVGCCLVKIAIEVENMNVFRRDTHERPGASHDHAEPVRM